MAFLTRVGIMALLCICTSMAATTTPTFELLEPICYLNGTIVLNNPDPSQYWYVTVNVTGCVASLSADNVAVTLTGCDIFNETGLIFSESETPAIITSAEYTAVVVCREIDAAGVAQHITQHFTPILMAAVVSSVTPTFSLQSALREYSYTGTPVLTAHLSTPLYWTIDLPASYFGSPYTCRVFPGTSVGPVFKELIVDGCSQDTDLLLDFNHTNSAIIGEFRRYWTTFYVFKFYNSNYITLFCDLDVCLDTATPCDISCGSHRRRSVKDSKLPTGTHASTSTSIRILDTPSLKFETSFSNAAPGFYAVHTLSLLFGTLLAAMLF